MPSARKARAYRQGPASIVVVIPIDWARGMKIEPGDELDLEYNGELVVRKAEGVEEPGQD